MKLVVCAVIKLNLYTIARKAATEFSNDCNNGCMRADGYDSNTFAEQRFQKERVIYEYCLHTTCIRVPIHSSNKGIAISISYFA